MRKTGNYRPKIQYRDLLGTIPFNIRDYKQINIAVEHDTGGTVLNLVSQLSHENELFLKYFEPEYEWADGTRQFRSDIRQHDAWYIKFIDTDMGLAHQTRLTVALDSKNEKFFPTRQSAINFINQSLKDEIL